MNKVNLTIDTVNSRVQIDFLASNNTTITGTRYINAPWVRMDVTGTGWRFDNIDEFSFNKEVFFSQIVLLNGDPIGATTYSDITTMLLALKQHVTIIPAPTSTDTPSMATYATSTTIPSGAKSVTVITDSIFAGTILGATASADSCVAMTSSLFSMIKFSDGAVPTASILPPAF